MLLSKRNFRCINSREKNIDNNIVSLGLYGVTIIDLGDGELTCYRGDGQCYECKDEEGE